MDIFTKYFWEIRNRLGTYNAIWENSLLAIWWLHWVVENDVNCDYVNQGFFCATSCHRISLCSLYSFDFSGIDYQPLIVQESNLLIRGSRQVYWKTKPGKEQKIPNLPIFKQYRVNQPNLGHFPSQLYDSSRLSKSPAYRKYIHLWRLTGQAV